MNWKNNRSFNIYSLQREWNEIYIDILTEKKKCNIWRETSLSFSFIYVCIHIYFLWNVIMYVYILKLFFFNYLGFIFHLTFNELHGLEMPRIYRNIDAPVSELIREKMRKENISVFIEGRKNEFQYSIMHCRDI